MDTPSPPAVSRPPVSRPGGFPPGRPGPPQGRSPFAIASFSPFMRGFLPGTLPPGFIPPRFPLGGAAPFPPSMPRPTTLIPSGEDAAKLTPTTTNPLFAIVEGQPQDPGSSPPPVWQDKLKLPNPVMVPSNPDFKKPTDMQVKDANFPPNEHLGKYF